MSDSRLELLHREAWKCHSEDYHHSCCHARSEFGGKPNFSFMHSPFPRSPIQFHVWVTQTGCTRNYWKKMTCVVSRRSVATSPESPNQFNRSIKPVCQHMKNTTLCGVQENNDSENIHSTSKKRLLDQTDLEDIGKASSALPHSHPPSVTKHRRTLTSSQRQLLQRETWRDVLGPLPAMGTTKVLHQYCSLDKY